MAQMLMRGEHCVKLAKQDTRFDLTTAKHAYDEQHIWHMYRDHCLDTFFGANQISLTFDDIKMIPYIVTHFDSIVPEVKNKKQTLKYTATIGDVTYTYVAAVSRIHSSNHRNLTLKTGWLTKQAKVGAVSSPQQSQGIAPSHFLRTASITPLERYIKKNYSEEARKIALKSYESGNALLAPNGKISNLEPTQWIAVRLQSFKNWFGDWENTPDKASKVVDDNGEPMVVYHGARHAGFVEFDSTLGDIRSNAPEGTLFFSSSREIAYSYTGSYEEADLWDADLQRKLLTNDIVDRHAIMVCYVYITTQNGDISVP